MTVQTTYRVARIASLLAGITTTSFFLLRFALSHRLITFQLVVFVVLKLYNTNKNYDTACAAALAAAAAAYDLPKSWYDEFHPSPPTAADSYYASPHEPMPMPPPEIIKETLEDDDEKEATTTSMDETWRAIMEARRREARRALNRNGTWHDRYRERVEMDDEWATSAARRELLTRRSESYSYKKKKHHVVDDVKALQKEDDDEEVIPDVGRDELFRRVETFIRMQHEHLRQQQLELELRRRFLERLHQRSS